MHTVVSRIAAQVLTPLAGVVALWLLLRSHGALGGGFLAAGAAGLGAVYRSVTIGARSLEQVIERGAASVIGVALLIMGTYAFAGLLWGDGVFAAASVTLPVPILGSKTLSTTLLFEAGVTIAVGAVVVAVLDELAGDQP